jgi:hypothetical protein
MSSGRIKTRVWLGFVAMQLRLTFSRGMSCCSGHCAAVGGGLARLKHLLYSYLTQQPGACMLLFDGYGVQG